MHASVFPRVSIVALGIIVTAALLQGRGGAQAPATETLVFAPAGDTFVESSSPTLNYGADTRLRVDADPVRIAYLRFEIHGVGERTVVGARLRLRVTGPSDESGGRVWVTDTAWDAATVTYATRPPLLGAPLDILGPVKSGALVELDLGGTVAGDGPYAFAIDSASDDSASYGSAEAGADQPALVLTVADGAPPVVSIEQPPDGAEFFRGDRVPLHAVVSDDADADLAALVEWTSSRDGFLGTGNGLAPALSGGAHTLTASVVDRDGLRGADQVGVSVVAPPPVNTEPLVTILVPLDGQTFTSGEPIPFRGAATDLDDGDLSARLVWRSARDGVIGAGSSFAAALSQGTHDVTATVADNGGLEGSATVRLDVLAPAALEVPPVADAYVSSSEPDRNLGQATDLRLDTDPVRIAYLRFVVTGIGSRRIARATLRMVVTGGFFAGSNDGGTLFGISNTTWQETAITYRNRPPIDGPAIGSVGAVAPGAVVEVDVTAAVRGDGVYSFALRTGSTDSVTYRSREAGGPLLVLVAEGHAPVVTIAHPADGAEVSEASLPVFFEAAAVDVEDGDLDEHVVWESDRDGLLGVGPTLHAFLSGARHRVTARATNRRGVTGRDEVAVTITPTPPTVTIAEPRDGATVFASGRVRFGGSAHDAADGDLSAALTWRSSRDGLLGTGARLEVAGLSEGEHAITAAVTDSSGLTGTARIGITARLGNAPPLVTIVAPVDEATFLTGEEVSLHATARDPEDGDVSTSIRWADARDGGAAVALPAGNPLALSTLAPGRHRLVAQAADSEGAVGEASVAIKVVSTTIVVPAAEDTYVDGNQPTTVLGGQALLSVDASPKREAYLRFVIDGVRPLAISRAILRLKVGSESAHASASGGAVRALAGASWSERTTTYATKPPVSGTVLAKAGGVARGATVDFDVSAGILADGVYGFALTTTSSDAASYLSRETGGGGGPALVLTLARNTPPAVVIKTPAAESMLLVDTSATLAAVASDAEDGDLGRLIEWSSDLDGPLGVGGSITTTTLRQGRHAITAAVADSSGAMAEATVPVVVDGPPSVAIVTPVAGSIHFTDETVAFRATATDVLEGDLGARVAWTSSLAGPLGTGAMVSAVLPAGVHTITASAADDRRLVGSAAVKITVEANDPPTVRIAAPVPGAHFVAGMGVQLLGTALDPEEGDLSEAIGWRSDRDGVLGSGAMLVTTTLSVGTHRIEASVLDRRGLAAVAVVTVTVETNDPPSIAITAPADGSAVRMGRTITFAASAIDPEDGDLRHRLTWRSDRDGPLGTGPTFSTAGLSIGRHRVTAAATDTLGLEGARSITLDVLNDPPVVTILSPIGGTRTIEGNPVVLRGEATDTEDGDLGASLIWTSSRSGTLGQGPVLETTRLSRGSHQITARAVDAGGAAGTRSVSFTVDPIPTGTGAPTVAILEPEDGKMVPAGVAVTLRGSAQDPDDGDLGGAIVWTSDRDGGLGTGQSVVPTSLSVGSHRLRATVTDRHGVVRFAERTIEVFPGAPEVTILLPEAGAGFLVGTPVDFFARAVDALEGDVAASLVWTSDRDGLLGVGRTITVAGLSVGVHGVAATATNDRGMTGSAEARFVVSTTTVSVGASADTYVDQGAPAALLGAEKTLLADAGPNVREAYLRFPVEGIGGLELRRARLRLQVGRDGRSDFAGRLHRLAGAWEESSTTWATRPPIDPAVVTGVNRAVDPDDIVEFDVTAALAGDGVHDFALVSTSENGVQYRSREAAVGRPALVLQLAQPPVQQIPTVTITEPESGLVVFDDTAVTLRAAARDVEDGDLSHAVNWRSDLDGTLGTGAALTLRLGRGTHTISATATDSFGLGVTDTVRVTVVDRPPAVIIGSPADGIYVPIGYPVAFTAAADDDLDGDLTPAIQWISSRDGLLGSGGSLTAAGLSPGDHRIRARVVNSLGTPGEEDVQLVVGQGPPEMALLAPAPETEVGEGHPLLLHAVAFDQEDGDLSASLVWRSDLDGVIAVGAMPTVRLATAGTRRITVTATDSHGLARSAETSVTVTPSGPLVTITAPGDGSAHLGALRFEATAIDARDGDLTGALCWTSSQGGVIGTGGVLPAVSLPPGLHVVTASATDREGRAGSAQTTVTVGALAPTVEITAPVAGDARRAGEIVVAAGAAVSFAGQAVDVDGGGLGTALVWRSHLAGTLATGRAFTASTLASGRHIVTASATGRSGLTGTARIVVIVEMPVGGSGAGGGSASPGAAAPTVTISAPASGAAIGAGASVSLAATARDREGTDLSRRVSWSSSLEGYLGQGATLATSLNAVGTHGITAMVADALGYVGSATVTVAVTAPFIRVPAAADTHTDDAEPTAGHGSATELRVDASPVREAFLRFVVTGVGERAVRRALVRLQATAAESAGGPHGGTIHSLAPGSWEEGTLTAANRPPIDGPALALAGTVVPAQTVELDVTAAVTGDGAHDFAIRPASTDLVTYRSREAGVGQPELLLFFDPPPLERPLVEILEPANGAAFPVGSSPRFRATAMDPQDGDLDRAILWTSSVQGLLALGPSVALTLGPGPHVITAWASDTDGNTGGSRIHVVMGDAPLVEISSPADGAVLPFGKPVVLAATAFDPEDGDLSFSLAWRSDVNGPLGVGPSIAAVLAPGVHTVTASATDAEGQVGAAAIVLTMKVGDVGYAGHKFGSGVDEDANRITGAKPESKLWYLDGVWWGTLYAPARRAYAIHRLDTATQRWVDTGVLVDERPGSRQDALLDGETLYLASRLSVPGGQNRLLRYRYRAGAETFVLDPGFPAVIPGGGTEALTLAKDTTDTLWIAFTLDDRVQVSHTIGSETAWAAPFVVPVGDRNPAAATVSFDDIAGVQALHGSIGIFWSNQLTHEDYFAVRRDGTPPADPSSWTLEVAATGGSVADDHLNMKLAADGRLFVAVKTSHTKATATLIGLLVRSSQGVWSGLHHVASTAFGPTRPLCLLDEARRRVHVFYSPFEEAIYRKTSDMDVIAFPDRDGIGTPFITSATTGFINNPTSTKQNIGPESGFVVLAASSSAYWHNAVDPVTPPQVTIAEPADGIRVPVNTPVTFRGTAFSVADGILSDAIGWSAERTGTIGHGRTVSGVVLPEGEHVVTAAVTDSAQATGRAAVRVTVARRGVPVVAIGEPAGLAPVLAGAPVTFAATATDALDGDLGAAIVWTSDRAGSLGTGTPISVNGLAAGRHEISAAATNAAGLTATATMTLDVQLPAPPVVEIAAPAAGTVADFGAALGFSATARDAFDGDVTHLLRWHSDRDGALGTGGSVTRSSLSFGAHVVTAAATDAHGLTGSSSVTVQIDDLPTVRITAPAEGSIFVEGDPVTLTATASDPQDGDLGATIVWRSDVAGPLGAGPRITVGSLSGGEHVITATATDRVGGQGSATRRLRVRGKPRVVITAPADGASVDPGGPLALAATATDTEDGDLGARVTWTSDGEGPLGTGARIVTTALTTVGERRLTAAVTDGDGFGATHRVTVHVNNGAAVSIVSPAEGARFDLGDAITLRATATDPEDGDLSAAVRWSADAGDVIGTGASGVVDTLAVGFHRIVADVVDSKGRAASAAVTIFVNGDPAVRITAPLPGAVLFTDALPLDFIAAARSVDGQDIGASVVWSSDRDGSLGTGGHIRPAALSVGAHLITATATDASGRSGAASVPIVVRAPNAPPRVTVLSPVSGTTVPAGTAITLRAGAVDDFEGDVSSRIAWRSDATGDLGTGPTRTVTLPEGVHRVTAGVVDSDGARGEATVTVTMGPTAPAVSITAPADGAVVFAGTPVTLRATALDATDGDLSGAVAWSSDRAGALGTGASIAVTLAADLHVITAQAADRGGLVGSARITIVVDALPTVRIAGPADGARILADRPLVLAALAVDPEDGEVSAAIQWTSSRDGVLGTGGMHAARGLSAGIHTITARATDRHGGAGAATLILDVNAAVRPIVAIADTYVDAERPATGSGGETTFRIDADPVRQAFLRFTVDRLAPFGVADAVLRLTVGPESSHEGDTGGTLYALAGGGWSEATTFDDRPEIDGSPIGSAGKVESGDAVRFGVGGVVTGEGTYDFALTSTSTDGVGYRSREASKQRPTLEVKLRHDVPPVVVIVSPLAGARVASGRAVSLVARAADAEDGDLAAAVVWESDVQGSLGRGATISVVLATGRHVLTASVTDGAGQVSRQALAIDAVAGL